MSDDKILEDASLPHEPIHRLTKPLSRFLHIEAASGGMLLICSLGAMAMANSDYADPFLAFWKTPIGISLGSFQIEHSLKHWINDGLMAIFFFVIGLEVKREIALGELKEIRRAALPVAAAIGGMAVPAMIYLSLHLGKLSQSGWGIPVATDIAFVVGCIAVLGRRVPSALRVMLLSLAIVDDIGAILVIAFGYTEQLHFDWLGVGMFGIALVLLVQRLGVRSIGVYTVLGFLVWLGFHQSGIHATIAGVVLGLLTPAHPYLRHRVAGRIVSRSVEVLFGESWSEDPQQAERVIQYLRVTRESISPLEYLNCVLHPWVAFGILPLFALANAGVAFQASDAISPVAVAVMLGLTIGKPVGVLSLTWLWLKVGATRLPSGVTWRHMIGGGFLAGIGFTMALFITGLAFSDDVLLRNAKVGVLMGSAISATIGMILLSTARIETSEKQAGIHDAG